MLIRRPPSAVFSMFRTQMLAAFTQWLRESKPTRAEIDCRDCSPRRPPCGRLLRWCDAADMIASPVGSASSVAIKVPSGKKSTERRDMSGSGPPFSGSFMTAPYYGGRSGAENVATVCACVDVISSAIAACRRYVYERLPDGNRVDVTATHPGGAYPATAEQPAIGPNLVRFFMGSTLLYGNALLTIEHDGAGNQCVLAAAMVERAALIVPASPTEAMGPLAPSARLAFERCGSSRHGAAPECQTIFRR